MAFRAAFTRSCFRRAARPTAAPQLRQALARRTYATGHEHAKAGGDAIWAAGAVGVTVPACWFILSNAPEPSHDHDDHGDSHGKSHDEEESKDEADEEKSESESEDKSEEKSEDKSKDKPEDKSEDKPEESKDATEDDEDSEKSEDSDSGDEGKDTPETSDDEGDEEPKKDEGEKKGSNTKKVVPDAKGGNKVRLESDKGTPAGDVEGPGATSGKHSGAQEGLSNTDTKHSTDISNDPSKTKKGENVPKSAKAKGTVEPKDAKSDQEK